MNFAQAMKQAASATETEDVAIGPAVYRVRRLTSMELVDAGSATLLAARPTQPHAPMPPVADVQRFTQSVVIAGVVAGSIDGGATFEPVRLVADAKDEDPDAGKLWIEHMIPGHAKALYAAILKLSTDGGRAADIVASFHRNAASDAVSRGE